MLNQNLARGVFVGAVALFFAANAARYPIGDLTHAGPGLFPLAVSLLLLLIGVLMIVQSRLRDARSRDAAPLSFQARNIALIMAALAGFVVLAKYVSTLAGVVVLICVASFAAKTFSWKRTAQISLVLIVVAWVFERFLGLNLRLLPWTF